MKTYANLPREERVKKILEQRRSDVVLVLENVTDPVNLSAILRTAESFGIGRICVIHKEGRKPKLHGYSSSGAVKWLDVLYFTSTTDCLAALKSEGFKILASYVDPEADVLWQGGYPGKVAVMVGNEVKGLTEDAIKMADWVVYLPMYGLTESLNVLVAASIFMYEVVRQKEAR